MGYGLMRMEATRRFLARRAGMLVLLTVIVALAVSPAANARIVAQAAPEGATWPEIHLVEIASGLEAPVDIASAGDGRLFVMEQAGRIRVVQPDGTMGSRHHSWTLARK